MFETTGRVDALICAAGLARFGPMTSLTDADFALGLHSKLMGQVNLVRLGMEHINAAEYLHQSNTHFEFPVISAF